jgi:hypothetical protein
VFGSVGMITERNLEFSHNTREGVVPLIFTNKKGEVVRVEVFSGQNEFFISISKVNKVRNSVVSMTVGSVNKEPLVSFFVINNGVDHIFLERLTLDIIRICRTNNRWSFNSHE